MTTAFGALVRKDLKLFFADRRAVIMSVLAPIAIASFFGYVFGGSGEVETSRIAVLAVDQDSSLISKDVVARLTSDKALAVTPSGLEQAREAVRKGRATVAIVIPRDFGVAAGRAFFNSADKPEIAMLYDPSHSSEMSMVQGILTGHVMEAVSKEVFAGQSGRQVVKDALADVENSSTLAPDEKRSLTGILRSVDEWNALNDGRGGGARAEGQGLSLPYQVRTEAVTSGAGVAYNGYAHSFGGMGIQFILFVGIDVGTQLLLQRKRGVWKRLRAAPLSRTVLLGSRAASAAITSFIVLMVIFGFARLVFGVRAQGSLLGLLAICAAFSFMTAAFGLLLAALGKTPEATRGLAILITLLLVMLGGAWVPSFLFPQWVQNVALFAPTRWAMDGLDAMTWRGLPFSAAIGPVAVLSGFALAFGAIAVMRFRWESDD